MQKTFLKPGATKSVSFKVKKEHLAAIIGSGTVEVFATPMLISGMEQASASVVESYLDECETTVGTHVDVAHYAATPLDMTVTFSAHLCEISPDGKTLTFKVEAFDEAGKIGSGYHKRIIVNKDEFEKKAASRRAQP